MTTRPSFPSPEAATPDDPGSLRSIRVAGFVLWGLAVLLLVPGLLVGPLYDDWFHYLDSHASGPWSERLFGLYDFFKPEEVHGARQQGLLPWWADDELSIRFFRPLSSLLLVFNHRVLDGGGLWAHLHAIVWYGLTVLMAHRVLALLFGSANARWATLLYALFGCHVLPLAFAAALHSHVTATFAFASFEYLIRAVQSGRPRFTAVSAALFVLALLGGESAIAIVPMALAHAASERGLGRALRLLAPHLLVLGAFAVGYVALGLGSHHSAGYLAPGSVAFFAELPKRWLLLMGGLLGWFPADLWLFGAEPALVVGGLLALGAAVFGVRALAAQLEAPVARRLYALLIGALTAVIPLTSGIPGSRLLIIPSLGAAALFALALRAAERAWLTGARVRALALGGWVASFGIGLGPLFRVLPPLDMARIGRELPEVARALGERCDGGTMLAVGTPESNAAYLPTLFLLGPSPKPRVFHVLSMAQGQHRLSRSGPNRYELQADGSFFTLPWARIYRDTPIPLGKNPMLDGVELDVLEASSARTRLDLRVTPGSGVCWVTLRDGDFVPLDPDAGEPLSWTPSTRPL